MDQTFINKTTSMSASPGQAKTKVIKRYGNRKLYDTEQSSYVVLKDIAKMIRNEEEVRVIDNETKDDITSATLTQIIFGAEKESSYSAPLDILKSIIKKGDGSLSNFLAEMGLFKIRISGGRLNLATRDSANKPGLCITTGLPAISNTKLYRKEWPARLWLQTQTKTKKLFFRLPATRKIIQGKGISWLWWRGSNPRPSG